jgi:hypothetical protein
VKKLIAAALDGAVGTALRLKTEIDAAHPDQSEAETRYRVRRLTLTGLPRKHNDIEPDSARLRLEIGVTVSGLSTVAGGDDAIDDAIDAVIATLDKPAALIDGTTRIELERLSSDDEPSGENESEASAVLIVEGLVIRTTA